MQYLTTLKNVTLEYKCPAATNTLAYYRSLKKFYLISTLLRNEVINFYGLFKNFEICSAVSLASKQCDQIGQSFELLATFYITIFYPNKQF
jgi:hypothetical protein